MPILDDVLYEEYERGRKILEAYRKEFNSLPAGYISYKRIGNKKYPYLQYRVGEKIVSDYVKQKDLEELITKLKRRKKLSAAIKNIERSNRKIGKALKIIK